MDAILFIHHRPLREAVTYKHYTLFKTFNPDCEIIPLNFEAPGDAIWQTHNHDVLVYDWFNKNKPKHERFFIMEWDTMATISVKQFFGSSYNSKVVGAKIVHPWSNDVMDTDMNDRTQRERDWYWFNLNSCPELYPYLRGIVPATCVMFSHDALFNMVELFYTKSKFKDLQCECRMGTLAAMAGYEPVEISPNAYKQISPRDVEIDCGPGIYHRVRG